MTEITIQDELRGVADVLEHLQPAPAYVDISWHRCTDDDLGAIVAAFPEATWEPGSHGTAEWLSGRVGRIRLVAHALDPEPTPAPSRLSELLRQAVDA